MKSSRRSFLKESAFAGATCLIGTPKFGLSTQHRGRSLSLSFRMESTTNGSRIPRLAEFAGIKDQLFRSHNGESRMEHPAFAKQSSLVDQTGIEPARLRRE